MLEFLLPFLADTEIASSLLDDGRSFDYWQQFINMLISLGILLTLIFVTVWFLKRFVASRNRLLNRSTAIQILERRNLSQKSFLYLIQVEKKKILISDSPTGASLICEIKPEELNEIESEEEEEGIPFVSSLSSKVKRFFVKNG